MDSEKKELGRWWFFILGLVIVSIIVFSVLGYFGKFTSTAVERKVFEQSYQKQAGDAQKLRIYQAQLAEINSKLLSADSETAKELEAQASMLRVQINSIK